MTYKLLNLNLLELQKLVCACLLMKSSFRLVCLAHLRIALGQGHELACSDFLEVLATTGFAGVSRHLDIRLDRCDTRNNALQRDQLSKVLCLDFTHRKSLLVGGWFEDDLAKS